MDKITILYLNSSVQYQIIIKLKDVAKIIIKLKEAAKMEPKLISSLVFILTLVVMMEAKKSKGYTGGEVKPGHYSIKEYHFHIYFRRNFEAEG